MAVHHPWAYQQALHKIEEAAQNDYPWLILERLGLPQLPPEIFELEQLQELVVIDNPLTSIPPQIIKLKNLHQLNLFYNEITELPLEIGSLSNLTHLDLSCNNLTSLPPEIANLTNLEYLDLRFNQLDLSESLLDQVNNPQRIIQNYLIDHELI